MDSIITNYGIDELTDAYNEMSNTMKVLRDKILEEGINNADYNSIFNAMERLTIEDKNRIFRIYELIFNEKMQTFLFG